MISVATGVTAAVGAGDMVGRAPEKSELPPVPQSLLSAVALPVCGDPKCCRVLVKLSNQAPIAAAQRTLHGVLLYGPRIFAVAFFVE